VVATLIVIGVSQWRMASEADIATVGSRDLASLSAAPSPSASASPSPAATGPWQTLNGAEQGQQVLLSVPVHLEIPRIDVDAKVLPVGLDENRAVAIPEDIFKIGWYELGVPPGAYRGSAVLVGHRDGREQGHGAFYDLGQLDVGDRVTVTDAAGGLLAYKVVSRELIEKKGLPYEELFSVDGPPRLTLISCGGYYDRNNGGYQDNVVVTAVPDYEASKPVPFPSGSPSSLASPSSSASGTSSLSSTPSGAAAAAGAGPVEVAVPQAGTIEESSQPGLLDGEALP
jgi:LPXTG-site transpeptidase (sortase) family protein